MAGRVSCTEKFLEVIDTLSTMILSAIEASCFNRIGKKKICIDSLKLPNGQNFLWPASLKFPIIAEAVA